MLWVIKDHGQSWDQYYFSETIIPAVSAFVEDPENVVDRDKSFLIHDCAPGWKSKRNQDALLDHGIQCVKPTGYGRWPGNSPDLNVAENLGAIIMDKVQDQIAKKSGPGKYSNKTLLKCLHKVLLETSQDTELFKNLVMSFPKRLMEVKKANGGAIPH